MSSTTTSTTGNTSAWRDDARDALHRLAVASCVGALLGLVVGGVGGRLFMGLLAGLNREDHGVITSDGFPMGEVTVSGTLNLLGLATVLGVLGSGVYLTLRGFRVGPSWLRYLSVVVGGTVMVGTVMVHEDGPDFTLLEPTLLVGGWLLARFATARPGSALDRAWPWMVRTALVALFALGFANLVAEIAAIYDTVSTGRYLLD